MRPYAQESRSIAISEFRRVAFANPPHHKWNWLRKRVICTCNNRARIFWHDDKRMTDKWGDDATHETSKSGCFSHSPHLYQWYGRLVARVKCRQRDCTAADDMWDEISISRSTRKKKSHNADEKFQPKKVEYQTRASTCCLTCCCWLRNTSTAPRI